jgi:hypothetical protein
MITVMGCQKYSWYWRDIFCSKEKEMICIRRQVVGERKFVCSMVLAMGVGAPLVGRDKLAMVAIFFVCD